MVALVAGHGTGLAEPPAPTQLPIGEQVVGGAATISRQQATMTINQSTSRAAIDWHTFDIGSQAHVNIRQPSTDSVLFNRILGNNPSQIFGGLTANGQVYLSNPSGFYFAPSASVNVGGLVATTHQLSLDEFMAGRDRFSRNGSTGRILNEGHLKAALGGYIALLAPEVRNHGVIMAELGTVALAAGEAYELRFDPARRLEGLRVEPAQIRTLVENKQAVLAPGGLIVLSAQGASQLQGSVVRHDGTLEASSLVSKGGRIMLEGDAITLGAHSTTTASGATGGGEVLVGGGWQGSGEMRQATTVTMASDSHIDVSATQRGDGGTAVLWSDVRNPAGSTRVAGTILANGGHEEGDGGRVETSGYHLDVDQAQVMAGAPRGQGGLWLLDPVGDTTLSDASSIVSSLNSGTNVEYFVDNGHLTVATNINKTSGGDATLTLKSDGNIAFINQNQSISSTSGRLNTLLWAEADSYAGGWVLLNPGTSIQTNGGGLWMGGGSGTMSWTPYAGGSPIIVGSGAGTAYGSTDSYRYGGINLNGNGGASIMLNAGAGNVYLRGANISTASNYLIGTRLFNTQITGAEVSLIGSGSAGNSNFSNHWGVSLESLSSITASGAVTLSGTGGGSSASGGNHHGVLLDNSTISTTSSPITITGTGGSSVGANNHGVRLSSGASVHATSGQISITGTGGGPGGSSGNDGVAFEGSGGSVYTTDSGTVTLTGTKGLGTNSEGFATNLSAGGTATLGHARQTGNLNLAASSVSFGSNGTSQILGTGAASITPLNATSAFTAAGDFSNLAMGSSLTGLTIGNRVNTADITLGRVTSIDGPVNLYGGNVNLNANLSTPNATTGDVSITAVTGVTGSGNIALANERTVTVSQSGNTTYRGVISGAGSLIKAGSGTLTLTGANSYSGATTVSGGTLASGAAGSLPDASAVTLNSGTTLNLNSFTETVGSLSGAGNITLGSAALRSGGNGTNTTYNGVISGTGSLIKAGSGTLTLTGANSYSGATTVSSGTVAVGNGGSTGTLGSGVVTSNAALVFNRSGNVALSTMALNAGGIGGTGSVSATASGDLTIDRSISVGGPVTLTASNGNLAINSAVSTPASTITLSAGGSGGTVTQGVSGSLSATNLALLGGNVTLQHSANAISTLAASGVTALTYADSDALTIGTVGAATGINATGPVRIETLSGDLTVAQNIATTNTGTSALILNAGKATAAGTMTGGNLLISGAPTVAIGSGGRATLYSGSINGSTGLTSLVGSGSGRFRYNSDESTTNYTLALGSGLHGIYRENSTVSVAVENKTMTYGDALPTWTYTTSGMANGDQVAQAFASPSVSVGGTTSTSGSYTAGNHTLTASGMTSSQLGYSVGTLTNGTMTVNTKAATLSGLTAADKVYDGTTTATVAHNAASFTGLVAGDTVTAAGTTGTFATKQVGIGKTVTLTGTTYGGVDAANYTFTDQSSTTAAITAKAATVSGLTAADKVYDGTTTATVAHSGVSFTGLVTGDTVTAAGTTGAFATKQVGTGKTVTLTGTTYAGADAGNYTFTDQASTTATITPKALLIDLQGQGNRAYDGTTTILLNGVTPSLTGVLGGDTVNVATGNVTGFVDKNVGTNKAVTYSGFGLNGTDAGNYLLSTGSAASTASITPKAVTVGGLTAANKVYDGTTAATVAHSGATFTGLVAGDTVTASGTIGTFADALVGIAKPVTLTGTVYGGADAGNYAFTPQTVTSASILARNTSSQFQQYLGGITQFSQNYKPVPGSSSTLPPQSPLLVTGTRASTGGAGTAGLATLFPIDGLIVNWIREHSVDGTRIVTVSIPQSIIARGDMISFELPEDLITALTTTPNQFAQTNGNPLPVWLEYNETRGQFRIAEPATISSLPYEVVANLEQSRVLVRIDTRVN
jgi:filamentous hemagglutinin family protein